MKPIIGITASDTIKEGHEGLKRSYMEAVALAGGLAIIIPTTGDDYEAYVELVDGIIFSGGVDISPLFYDREPIQDLNYTSIRRDKSELGLFKEAYSRSLPILGICRGLQLMNVALGGSLYQDLRSEYPDSLGHSPRQGSDNIHHSIEIEEESILGQALGSSRAYINSFHHQAIDRLGENLRVTSRARDGIIESVEGMDDRFLLGLQFHPENLVKDYPEFLNIFRRLVEASKEARP